MPDALRCGLFTPISTHQLGNGLAHRARFWHEVLAGFGPVTTVVIPLAGTPPARDLTGPVETIVPLTTQVGSSANLPSRARLAPEQAGRMWQSHGDSFDLVVVLRAYCAPFAFGAVAGTDAVVVVDLDDDDATFHDDAGHPQEAAKYRALVAEIDRRAERVISVTGFGSTSAIANSVEPAPARSADRIPGRRVIMVGNFGYLPNIDGARWFIDEVLPHCDDDFDFVVAGPGSDQFAPFGIGYAPDLGALYAGADVVVVPLLSGSGSRIKAIEAFAAGVPVVATSIGLSGLDVRPGVDCEVADDPAAFAAAVLQLIDNPDRARQIAAAALADVVPHYSRQHVAETAVGVLLECLHEPAQRMPARAPGLEITEEGDALVVTDPSALTTHRLTGWEAAIFVTADGTSTVAETVEELAQVRGRSDELAAQVRATAAALARAGLIHTIRRRKADMPGA
ncbi:MAG TPA: glycosyltransferase [Ilumatobacteraceae bacterium]|nr:glycosyltransferase [Ilumatobacteraceae bacterium]